MDTLSLALKHRGYKVEMEGLSLYLHGADPDSVSDMLFDMSDAAFPAETELVSQVLNKVQEKWDWLLPDELLGRNYASHNLDVSGARRYFGELTSQGAFRSYT